MAEEKKKETKKGKKQMRAWMVGGAVAAIPISILMYIGQDSGYKQGVRESSVYHIASVGDLNNDGIDDLVAHDRVRGTTVYICRESGICVSQDDYLTNVNAEMNYNTQDKVNKLKKMIDENFKKFRLKEIKETKEESK